MVRETRVKVTIRASMRADGPRTDVCIRDISPRGLMMIAAVAPPAGTYVEVTGVNQTIVGRVTWSKDRRFGIRTSDRIDLSAAIFGGAAQASGQEIASGPQTRPAGARPKDGREKLASNRAFGRAAQFIVIAAFAAALSIAMAMAAFDTLSRSLSRASSQLGGAQPK